MCLRFWKWCCCCCKDSGYHRMNSYGRGSRAERSFGEPSTVVVHRAEKTTSDILPLPSESSESLSGSKQGSNEGSKQGSNEGSNEASNLGSNRSNNACSGDTQASYGEVHDSQSGKFGAMHVQRLNNSRNSVNVHFTAAYANETSDSSCCSKATERKRQSCVGSRPNLGRRNIPRSKSDYQPYDHHDVDTGEPIPFTQSHGDLKENRNSDRATAIDRLKNHREEHALDRGEVIVENSNKEHSPDKTYKVKDPIDILDQFTRKDSDMFSQDSSPGRAREKQVYTLADHRSPRLAAMNVTFPSKTATTVTTTTDDSLYGFGVLCEPAHSYIIPSKPSAARGSDGGEVYRSAQKVDSWYDELTYGTIHFTTSYFKSTQKVFVHVTNIDDLPVKTENFAYDVILKICILPKENGNNSTKNSHICKRSLDPIFNEDFAFYVKDINVRTLKVSVYDVNYQNSLNAIGHTLLYLGNMQQDDKVDSHDCKLYRQCTSDICKGYIQLTMTLDRTTDNLILVVKRAKGLLPLLPQITDSNEGLNLPESHLQSTFVKVALHCGEAVIKSKISHDVFDICNPQYDTGFKFNLRKTKNPFENFIVVTVMKKTITNESEIGRVVVGPFYYATDHSGIQTTTPWGLIMTKEKTVSTWYRMYS